MLHSNKIISPCIGKILAVVNDATLRKAKCKIGELGLKPPACHVSTNLLSLNFYASEKLHSQNFCQLCIFVGAAGVCMVINSLQYWNKQWRNAKHAAHNTFMFISLELVHFACLTKTVAELPLVSSWVSLVRRFLQFCNFSRTKGLLLVILVVNFRSWLIIVWHFQFSLHNNFDTFIFLLCFLVLLKIILCLIF